MKIKLGLAKPIVSRSCAGGEKLGNVFSRARTILVGLTTMVPSRSPLPKRQAT